MRRRILVDAVFLSILGVLDIFVNQWFLPDISFQHLVFISSMHLFGLAYLTADYSFREMIVVAFVFGLVFDLGGYQALPVRLVSYPLAMMIIWEYRRHIADSSLALVLLLLIAVFVTDILMYFVYLFFTGMHWSLLAYIEHVVVISVLGNLVLMPLAAWLYQRRGRVLRRYEAGLKMQERSLKVRHPDE